MFPLTHIWYCRRLQGKLDNTEILGSIFPDIVITKCLDYSDTHYCSMELPKYLRHKGLEKLAKAIVTHTVNPKGLDYYGDEHFKKSLQKGYCFQKAEAIVEDVIKYCHIPEEFGLWKAHNFIEMGIEANLAERNPELPGAMHQALNDKEAITEVSKALEDYYKLKRGTISEAFMEFSMFVELQEVNSRNLALKFELQMIRKHGVYINVEKAAELIDVSRDIILEDFDEFIDYCSDKICKELADF